MANNEAGTGSSDQVYLDVKCKPLYTLTINNKETFEMHFSILKFQIFQFALAKVKALVLAGTRRPKLSAKLIPILLPGDLRELNSKISKTIDEMHQRLLNSPSIFPHSRWQFNSTSQILPVPSENILVDGSVSVASYKPKTEMDYGTLLCWADNELGRQAVPCVYHIIPAGRFCNT